MKGLEFTVLIIVMFVIAACSSDADNPKIVKTAAIEFRENENDYFVDLKNPNFQLAVVDFEHLSLNNHGSPDYNFVSKVPYFEDDRIFIVISNHNIYELLIYDLDGNFINKIQFPFSFRPEYLSYIKSRSILAISDGDNSNLHLANIENGEFETIDIGYSFFKAHFIETSKTWAIYSGKVNSNNQLSSLISYKDEQFNDIGQLEIPNHSSISMAKSAGLKLIQDELYFNTWGSSAIYKITDMSLNKIYEVPEKHSGAAGLNNYFIGDNFILVTVKSKIGSLYTIYHEINTGKSLYIPAARIANPLETDYRFFNIPPVAAAGPYLYLALDKTGFENDRSFMGASKFENINMDFQSDTDLFLQKYRLDVEFLESISEIEIPLYLK